MAKTQVLFVLGYTTDSLFSGRKFDYFYDCWASQSKAVTKQSPYMIGLGEVPHRCRQLPGAPGLVDQFLCSVFRIILWCDCCQVCLRRLCWVSNCCCSLWSEVCHFPEVMSVESICSTPMAFVYGCC